MNRGGTKRNTAIRKTLKWHLRLTMIAVRVSVLVLFGTALFAQQNAAIPEGRSVPLALENTIRQFGNHSNGFASPSESMSQPTPGEFQMPSDKFARLRLPEPVAKKDTGVAPTNKCSVPLLEMDIPSHKNFTIREAPADTKMDSSMIHEPPLAACAK
jgi:hypothetical protein